MSCAKNSTTRVFNFLAGFIHLSNYSHCPRVWTRRTGLKSRSFRPLSAPLHDPASQLMDMLIQALSQGKLCVVDVSQLRGAQAMILSGLILRRIFDRNQQEFTEANPRTIPTIAVIEEAQSVLVEGAVSAEPYIAWVKEGRKYDLGAVLVTQQPGSIPVEI